MSHLGGGRSQDTAKRSALEVQACFRHFGDIRFSLLSFQNFDSFVTKLEKDGKKPASILFYINSEKIIGKNAYHFKKIIVRYKKIGYNINVMRQTACLVVIPIKVNSFAYLFNFTTVGRTSDRMTVPS